MTIPNLKIAGALLFAMALSALGALSMPAAVVPDKPPIRPEDAVKPGRRCIILWMGGGPSQLDTFDPKQGNIALFKAIDTNVKGLQLAESLPLLAKQANHLAIIRSLTHRDNNHIGGAHLMRTGYASASPVDHPSLGCVLAKELADEKAILPRFVCIDSRSNGRGYGPGILGPKFAPVTVGNNTGFGGPPLQPQGFPLPAAEAFDIVGDGKGFVLRQAVEKAFDFSTEKDELRDAYGRGRFGSGCLLARRLIESGVPVVEITMGGWDMHGNAKASITRLGGELDAGMATLVKDLDEKRLLDSTLIVWMGEFGRTPTINNGQGRDHWASCFSAVLAGGGIKGGQAIGKTAANGALVEARPVTPPEFLATIYSALSIDPHKGIRLPSGQVIPLIERGNNPVKEAQR